MPHLTTDESYDMPNFNKLGINYRKPDQYYDQPFSDISICCEYKRGDFYYYEKTKRNRVCGGLCSYSPSGDQDLDILASGLVRSTLLSLLAFVMQRLSGSLYQLTNFNHQPGGQGR